ncbi:MAG: cupin domain-containing protein, partial [Nitrospiraceae bacterium]
MVHVTLGDRPEFLAGDHTVLRELLHPAKQPVALGYSLAHGTLAPGCRSKWHRLISSEVYY